MSGTPNVQIFYSLNTPNFNSFLLYQQTLISDARLLRAPLIIPIHESVTTLL
ncbi:hypothetical protein APA_1176 [Pseudanabaena sp. lw0831]|nr:hypothetical protein APA_1176 [Pseudanabaena sp. lw0831]